MQKEKKIKSIFEKEGFSVHYPKFGSGMHYACYADAMSTAVINYDGRVFKCTTPDFERTTEDGILSENGYIIWNEDRIARRLAKATFDNKYCLKCKYLPVCSGGCTTHKSSISDKCRFKLFYRYAILELMKKFDKHDYKIAHFSQL